MSVSFVATKSQVSCDHAKSLKYIMQNAGATKIAQRRVESAGLQDFVACEYAMQHDIFPLCSCVHLQMRVCSINRSSCALIEVIAPIALVENICFQQDEIRANLKRCYSFLGDLQSDSNLRDTVPLYFPESG